MSDIEKKYKKIDGYHYIAEDMSTGFVTKDYLNKAGILTTYINKQYGVIIPSLYERKKYYNKNGKYWWEQWFKIILVKDKETKKCPYCDWETIDITNKSGMFETHLKKKHNITKTEYLKEYPNDKKYFELVNKSLNIQFETDEKKYVECKICGIKFKRITKRHLHTHNITKAEYELLYGENSLLSQDFKEKLQDSALKMNLSLNGNDKRFVSKDENEIRDYINKLGFVTEKNRSILHGMEIDIYIPSKKIAIEYNGCKWHSEFFGKKDKNYHINKLLQCKRLGIDMIMIFEDEYKENKELVLSKIRHILGVDNDIVKIGARKTTIQEIDNILAAEFLEQNHIQGFSSSTIYLGSFYNQKLCAVMSFLEDKKNDEWTLSRFAVSQDILCQGVGGKLLSYFTKHYIFNTIKSFADRRWTINENNNLYTKIGFHFDGFVKPNYRYFNSHIDRCKRFHKFGFRKNILVKKYGLSPNMTELEMAKKLGYDRIWDCGLIRYVYNKND